jgi:hypothetical protein
MPACPNCGRQTLRTKDWACQWCGYPLLSRSYKKIDKTFKELQEERNAAIKAPPPLEPEFDLDAELELAPETPPETAGEPTPKFQIAPEHAPRPEPAEPLPELPPTPDVPFAPKAAIKPEPEAAPGPEPSPGPGPEPMKPPESGREPEPESPPVQISPPEPAPQLASQPPAGPAPEPEPPPVAAPSLESIDDGAILSVDELDALFKADRMGAHDRLSGKAVVIKGFVEKVFIRDHIDVRYIVLTGARKKVLWPVRCTFGKEGISQMSRLAEGQEVTVRGRYDSYGKNIIFKDCELA